MESPNLLMVTWQYLAHFLIDSYQLWFKWYSNDIASSRMVLNEITQPLMKEFAKSSPFID